MRYSYFKIELRRVGGSQFVPLSYRFRWPIRGENSRYCILLNARIKQVSGKCRDSVSVVVEQNGIEKVLKGSHVLVATGRNPNTEGLGLELTGVELTDRGYIKVNERLQTTARPASGRSARSQVARSSRTSASTISA